MDGCYWDHALPGQMQQCRECRGKSKSTEASGLPTIAYILKEQVIPSSQQFIISWSRDSRYLEFKLLLVMKSYMC